MRFLHSFHETTKHLASSILSTSPVSFKMKFFASTITLLASATSVTAQCQLPSTYRWSSSGALAQPKNGWVNLKDFTVAPYNGQNLVYATNHDTGSSYGSMNFGLFSDWSQMGNVAQNGM